MIGRPFKYNKEIIPQAYKLSLLGLTDPEMAKFFEVSESCFNKWKARYPDLLQAIKAGKLIADGEVVQSLYKRATGYQYEEVHIEKITLLSTIKGKQVRVPAEKRKTILKEIAPEVVAQIFWLKNRMPSQWRDKRDVELSGSVESVSKTPFSIEMRD